MKRKGKSLVWIGLIIGLTFFGIVATLLYKGRGRIYTWMTFRGKEPVERGKIYARLNRYNEAIAQFKKEVEKNPESFEAHYQLGLAYNRIAEFDRALSEYEIASTLRPDYTDTDVEVASTYLNKAVQSRNAGQDEATVSKLLQQAIDSCDEILSKQPQNLKALVLKGKMYIELGDPESAITCFNNALAINKNYAEAHLGLIDLYVAKRDYIKAEAMSLEALKQNPGDFAIGLNLALIYIQQGREEAALKTLSGLTGNKDKQIQINVMKGLLCLRMGRYQEASDAAEKASELASSRDIPVVEYIRGVIALQDKDYSKSIAHLRQATAHMPNSPEAHYFLALALIETQKKEEAKTELLSAIGSNKEYAPAKFTLAQILAQEGRWEESTSYIKEILEQDPSNIFAMELLGKAFQAQGNFQQARQAFSRLTELDPLSANKNLAYLDFAEGKIGKCLRTCDAVLAEDPDQPGVLYLKGLALFRSGDLTAASQSFKEVLKLEPDFLPATHELAKISQALGNKDEAVSILTNNLKRKEKDVTSYLLLAVIHEETKEIRKAQQEVEQAIEIDNGYIPSYMALGRIYIIQTKYDKAVNTYRKGLKLQPSEALLHIGKGTACQLMGDLQGAEEAFQEVIRIAPNSPSGYAMLVNVYLNAEQTDRATETIDGSPLTQEQKKLYRDFISDVATIRSNSEVLKDLNEAIFFGTNYSYSNALEKCKEVAKAVPGNALVSMYLANLLTAKGKSAEAVKVYEALTLSSESNLPSIYQEMGKTYLSMRDYDKAIWALEEAVVSNQADPSARLQLSELYLQKGDTEKALALAKDVLSQDPKNAFALNLLGQSYLTKGELEKAEKQFSKAAERGDIQDVSRYNLAKTKFLKGEVEDCIKECKNGLEKNPTNPDLHHLLGVALVKKGEIAEAQEEFIKAVDIDPHYVQGYLSIASIHNLQGRPDLALSICGAALESNPDSLDIMLMLAGCYAGLGKYEKALEQYQKCLAQKNNEPQALFGLSTVYFLKGDIDRALDTLQTLLDQRTDFPPAYLVLAEIYRKQGHINQAIQTFENLQKTAPESVPLATLALLYLTQGDYDKCLQLPQEAVPHLLWIKAIAYQLKGRYREAESNCEEALQASNGDVSTALSLANIALASGERQRAKSVIEKANLPAMLKQAYSKLITTTPDGTAPKFAAHMNVMLVYLAEGWVKEALEECKKAKSLVPESIAVSDLLGQNLIMAGEMEQAASTFADIIQKDSSYSPAYGSLAYIYTLKGDKEMALDTYRRLVEIEPNSSRAHLQIAMFLQRREDIDGCIKEYKKVIELAPSSAERIVAFNNLAWVLATKKGSLDEALQYAVRARELAPNHAEIMDTLGWIYCLSGKYTEAVKELQQASRLSYGNPSVYFHLGVAYLKKGMDSRALLQLQRAIKAGVDFPEIEEAKRLVKEIEKGTAKVSGTSTF
ncbi:MAG TPA: tetratricopeptide repeat protein [Candidatus Hypogeohydataceae bacterium YC40]